MDNLHLFSDEPNIFQLLNMIKDRTKAELNVMRIGIIREVIDPQTVRAEITNTLTLKQNFDGTNVTQPIPPIKAKVIYLGSGGVKNSFPPVVDTPCLMLFNDREMDSYFINYSVNDLSDFRMHDLNDCFCLPIWFPTIQPASYDIISDVPININSSEAINIQSAAEINLTAPQININGSSAISLTSPTTTINGNFVVTGTSNLGGTTTIEGKAFLPHTHTSTSPGTPTSGVN